MSTVVGCTRISMYYKGSPVFEGNPISSLSIEEEDVDIQVHALINQYVPSTLDQLLPLYTYKKTIQGLQIIGESKLSILVTLVAVRNLQFFVNTVIDRSAPIRLPVDLSTHVLQEGRDYEIHVENKGDCFEVAYKESVRVDDEKENEHKVEDGHTEQFEERMNDPYPDLDKGALRRRIDEIDIRLKFIRHETRIIGVERNSRVKLDPELYKEQTKLLLELGVLESILAQRDLTHKSA